MQNGFVQEIFRVVQIFFLAFSFSNLDYFLLFFSCLIHQYLLPSIHYHDTYLFYTLWPLAGPVMNCIEKTLPSTFQMDQLGKIRRHHWTQRLKISKIAKL